MDTLDKDNLNMKVTLINRKKLYKAKVWESI